jgi:hypothetical protein
MRRPILETMYFLYEKGVFFKTVSDFALFTVPVYLKPLRRIPDIGKRRRHR